MIGRGKLGERELIYILYVLLVIVLVGMRNVVVVRNNLEILVVKYNKD